MALIFSAENCEVEIYLDDGTGSPAGSALFTFEYGRARGRSFNMQYERIPHAGYPYDEIAAGKVQFRVDLAKMVEGITTDLFLTDALYYIRVIDRNDDYSSWVRYNCKKCRRVNWNMPTGDIGGVAVQVEFVCEQIVRENVP